MCKDCGCGNNNDIHAHPTLRETKTIEVVDEILSRNNNEANHLRKHFKEGQVMSINIMGSPGCGKTSLLELTIKNSNFNIAVLEGDLQTNKDEIRIKNAGGRAHQITTGSTCHLDAFMIHEALHHIDLKDMELCFIENVGNLVCPASYDVGSFINVVLLSVPEGSDKIEKYPVMFKKADVVLITKIDLINHFDFNLTEIKEALNNINPNADIIYIDSKNPLNEGFNNWIEYLTKEYKKFKEIEYVS